VGLFDWLTGRRGQPASTTPEATNAWSLVCDADEVVIEDGRGASFRVPLPRARRVRVVPLTGGTRHRGAGGGWQVALARAEGDVLVGPPTADWRRAREVAQVLCAKTELPMDELTQRMFSRVGQLAPKEA
jgi:hypothetical protein